MATRNNQADQLRKQLNRQQTELRQAMMASDYHPAIHLFMQQHAALHSSRGSQMNNPSLEDLILDDLSREQARCRPPNGEHSIAWCLWHIARIEDTAMNMLVAGSPQVLETGSWADKIGVQVLESGNAMDPAAIDEFSGRVDVGALRSYRHAVGQRTRQIVAALRPEDLKEKVDPDRIRKVLEQGAVAEAASGITDYWGRRTIAGLLLMPATRHSLVHLNEALRIKSKI